jgi:hypothetical protein
MSAEAIMINEAQKFAAGALSGFFSNNPSIRPFVVGSGLGMGAGAVSHVVHPDQNTPLWQDMARGGVIGASPALAMIGANKIRTAITGNPKPLISSLGTLGKGMTVGMLSDQVLTGGESPFASAALGGMMGYLL